MSAALTLEEFHDLPVGSDVEFTADKPGKVDERWEKIGENAWLPVPDTDLQRGMRLFIEVALGSAPDSAFRRSIEKGKLFLRESLAA